MVFRFNFMALLLGLSCYGFAEPALDHAKAEINNFGVVCDHDGCAQPHIFRSSNDWGRYQSREALAALQVETVINLMTEQSCASLDPDQQFDCQDHPINPFHVWSLEEEDFAEAFFAVQDAAEQGRVVINCQRGSDRTGILSAILEIHGQACHQQNHPDQLNQIKEGISQRLDQYGFNHLFYSIWRAKVLSWVHQPPAWLCESE